MQGNTTLSRFQVILMAVAAGVSAANLNYNQPILKEIALSFSIPVSKAGVISMLTQAGYGLGLFFITPLGDKVNKKNLILTLLALLFISLLLMVTAVNIQQVWLLSILIGILSVSVQIILPMAASLDPLRRGKTVGIIFSGLLTGILASRVIAGFVAEWLSWRYVYGLSAVLILVVLIMLKVSLPDVRNEFKGNYLQLLRSGLSQIKRFPLLRQTSLAGGLLFGVFCSFWTTLTFHLSGPPFYFHANTIGIFGIIAIVGALMTPTIGKLADRGNKIKSLFLSISMIMTGLVLLKFFPDSLLTLAIAVLILNIGVPANQVTNLAIIYALDETSPSRINTIYMTTYFIGGAAGTFAGILCWKYGGWSLVTWQMMIWAFLALGVIAKTIRLLGIYKVATGNVYLHKN